MAARRDCQRNLKSWSDAERERFIACYKSGATYVEIAREFNLADGSVQYWLKKFGVKLRLRPRPYQKKRKRKTGTRRACLGCDRVFRSEGIHNRLCPHCHGTVDYREGRDYEQAIQTIGG
jgi:rRNA maturation endonuclease Nob1